MACMQKALLILCLTVGLVPGSTLNLAVEADGLNVGVGRPDTHRRSLLVLVNTPVLDRRR